MCNMVPTVLHIYVKELQQELFHTSAPKDGNRTHFWDVDFMLWIRIFNEDREGITAIITSDYQYFSLIQCISIY
jgi:hypothetical protein